MSVNNNIFFGKKQSNIYKKRNHQSNLKCLKECSNYNLSISCNQRNEGNYSFFSKILHSYQNNIFIFNNLFPSEIISTISQKSIIDKENNIISCIYKIIEDKSDTKVEQILENEKILLPLESEKLNFNFLNIENYISCKGPNLLLKFDLYDNRPIVFDKNILYNIFSYKINAKLHGRKNLFDKDILFLVDIKKVVKSIQIRLENLQKDENKNIDRINEIFVPLLQYENIGFIISPNFGSSPLNLRKLKTNFNSVVKQKFVLKSILISLNISTLNKNSNLAIDSENISNLSELAIQKTDISKEKSNDCITDENTSQSSNHNSNSPKIYDKNEKQLNESMDFQYMNKSFSNSFILSNINYNINNLNNDETNYAKNSFIINNNSNQYNNSYYSINSKRKFDNLKKNIQYNYSNYSFYNINNIRNKYSSYLTNYNINTIIFNSNDIFSKTLFNRYQDKSNSTCNLKILMEFLKVQLKKSLSNLTIYDFFYSFYKVSSLSLKIPFFKNDGKLIQSTLTPSLNELNLYINNSKLIKKLENKFKMTLKNSTSSSISRSSDEEVITKQIDDFLVSIIENKSLVKISFKENKPYYLTDSLYDKLEKLMNNLKYIKKLNIGKNVLLEKSYISIQWSIINGNNTLSSSFISYHLFNGNMLGVLSDIKEKENSFWLNSIEEINNKRIKVDYNYLPKENYIKIYDFINSI